MRTPEPSVLTLPEQVAALPDEERNVFDNLFSVTRSRGELVPPPEMEAWILRTFGSAEAVRSQTVIKTLNRWTLEGSLFNDLRARRPVQSRPDLAIQGLQSDGTDPFCNPLTGTTADTFGRVRGRMSITASNVAKYDGLHAVIIMNDHNPLEWSQERLSDGLDTARRWLIEAHRSRPSAIYPFVMWNCLPRSGASQLHAHMQAALSEGCAYGRVELWRRSAVEYRQHYGRSYFEDFYAAHRSLGLGGSFDAGVEGGEGAVRWMAHLTPMREKELLLLAGVMGEGLYTGLHRMLRVYLDELAVRSWNVAIYLPPLAPAGEDWSDFPVIVRMVDRGDPSSSTSDIGAMELFAQPIVAFDPWKLADRVLSSK